MGRSIKHELHKEGLADQATTWSVPTHMCSHLTHHDLHYLYK